MSIKVASVNLPTEKVILDIENTTDIIDIKELIIKIYGGNKWKIVRYGLLSQFAKLVRVKAVWVQIPCLPP